MLRIDRNIMPELPRPVFAIQAEHAPVGEIMVSVLAGQNENSRCEEFQLMEKQKLEHFLLLWLHDVPYFGAGHAAWERASGRAAIRIAQWAHETLLTAAIEGESHE